MRPAVRATAVPLKKPDGSVTLSDKLADEKKVFKARPRLNSGQKLSQPLKLAKEVVDN